MTTAIDLNEKDWKDFSKFNKHLVFKAIQVIIQSRTGQMVVTQSKLIASGSDWFNLSVRDDTSVMAEMRKVYSKYGSEGLRPGKDPLCIDVVLHPKIMNEEKVPLETWWIQMTNVRDKSVRVSFGVYNRMSVLLKCLFIISRAAPAYRTCRDYMRDGSKVRNSVYIGKPQMTQLGEKIVKNLVGSVPTPVGTIEIHLAYRVDVEFLKKLNLETLITDNMNEDHFACPVSDDSDVGKDYVHVARSESSFDVVDSGEEVEKSSSSSAERTMEKEEINLGQEESTNSNLDAARSVSPQSEPEKNDEEKSGRDEHDQSVDKELREFYKESLAAPSLHMFTQPPADDLVLENLSFALAEFEANAQKFDDFFNSIDNLELK